MGHGTYILVTWENDDRLGQLTIYGGENDDRYGAIHDRKTDRDLPHNRSLLGSPVFDLILG